MTQFPGGQKGEIFYIIKIAERVESRILLWFGYWGLTDSYLGAERDAAKVRLLVDSIEDVLVLDRLVRCRRHFNVAI